MIARTAPDAPLQTALTEAEMTVVHRAVRDRPTIPAEKTVLHYLLKIACLGGYLARRRDRPLGNTVMWRGWSRLMDMMLGANLMQPNVGNRKDQRTVTTSYCIGFCWLAAATRKMRSHLPGREPFR